MARPGIVRVLGALDKKELRPVLSGSQNCRHRGSRLPVLIGEKPRPKTAERGTELLDRQHGPYCGRNKRAWGVGRGAWALGRGAWDLGSSLKPFWGVASGC